MFWAEIWNISEFFNWKISTFGGEIFYIYLNRHVFVMLSSLWAATCENIPADTYVYATRGASSLRSPHEETLYPWLSKMHQVKILIRLCDCTLWSLTSWAHMSEGTFSDERDSLLFVYYFLQTFLPQNSVPVCLITKRFLMSSYSKISMTRTPMTHLPWLIRTRFWVPRKFFR